MCVLLGGIESHPDDQAFTTSMDNAKEKRRRGKGGGRERKLGGGEGSYVKRSETL